MIFKPTNNPNVYQNRDCGCKVELTPYNEFLFPCLVHSLPECEVESDRLLELAKREWGGRSEAA